MTIPLTVALTTYNRCHYLRQALPAILGQTYGDFELLVLDNGSTDETPYYVLECKDSRLRYIRNPPGHTSSFNSISAQWIARSERLLITHDDDIMEPKMLERQMALISQRPDLTAIWTNKSIIDADNNQIHPWITPPGPTRIFEQGEYIARVTEERLWYPASSMIFMPHLLSTNTLLRTYRGVKDSRQRPITIGAGEHVRTALMNLKGPVAFLNEPLLRYRQHGVQETQDVHLARAAMHTFQSLRKLVRKTSYREQYEPMFDAQIARFQAQDLVLQQQKATFGQSVLRRLEAILLKGLDGLGENTRVAQPLLPLLVLLLQSGRVDIATRVLDRMQAPAADATTAIRLLYRWAAHVRAGNNIFSHMRGQRVVILGSSLLAALLVIEARNAQVEVVCCLDSNRTRQSTSWLGLSVVPPSWLASREETVDALVFSSERDHEDKLLMMVRSHDPELPALSWKSLVEDVK